MIGLAIHKENFMRGGSRTIPNTTGARQGQSSVEVQRQCTKLKMTSDVTFEEKPREGGKPCA